uniref:Sulfotransferase n=1 Tax=Oryza glaberrima TaxID=4538 RepID=I1QXI7_ORYGL
MAPSFRLSSAPESADEATAHNKEIYDQLRRVAETFPSAPSLIGLPCSRHPDGWYTFTNGVVSSMVIKEHLTARATDIFLTTFPKSSTTWLKALLYSTLHRGTDELVAHSPHQLVPFLESQVFANDRIPKLSSLPSPRLFMTHIPSQSLPDSVAASGCKVVYLCRDPKDCFVSLWHFWNRFMPWDIDEAHRQFCDGARSLGRSGSISSATGGGTSRSRTRKNNFFLQGLRTSWLPPQLPNRPTERLTRKSMTNSGKSWRPSRRQSAASANHTVATLTDGTCPGGGL